MHFAIFTVNICLYWPISGKLYNACFGVLSVRAQGILLLLVLCSLCGLIYITHRKGWVSSQFMHHMHYWQQCPESEGLKVICNVFFQC